MTTQPDIPPDAFTDAAADIARQFIAEHGFSPDAEEAMLISRLAAAAIKAAAPHIAAAERRRIHETSFDPDDEARLGLFKLAAADGALAERERIRQVITGMRDELADHARQAASLPMTSRTLAARAETLDAVLGRIGGDQP